MFSRFIYALAIAFSLTLVSCGDDDKKDDNGGNGGNGGSDKCDTTNPKGKSCTEAKNCKVECRCADGNITSGVCAGNSCSEINCDEACEESELGAFKKACFVGEASSSGGGDNGDKAGTVKRNNPCTAHTDCEGFNSSNGIDNSPVHCITYCSNKFCAKNCNKGESCGIDTCDDGIRSCIPSKYECGW